MSAATAAILASWTLDAWLLLPLLAAALYLHGWRDLRRRQPARFPAWQLASYMTGLGVLVVAVASPIDVLAGLLLHVHMLQHMLLTLVAPPLMLLGRPGLPMLCGLPATVRTAWLGPFMASPGLRRAGEHLGRPAVCWCAFTACFWIWHVPSLYELALRSPAWHRFEHATFIASALLFWWPIIGPRGAPSARARWTAILYLLAASIQNTVFSAAFAFSDRVFYPVYALAPRINGLTALQDQAAAGALMWVVGSLFMLIPAALITRDLLTPAALLRARPIHLPVLVRGAPRTPFDLLRVPVLGAILRRRGARMALRAVMLLGAAAIVADGLLGPREAPMNLAGVLPWIHWRGVLIIALLAGGNFFCMTCPFVLPRALGRRLLPSRGSWPRWLRSKWLAAALVAGFLVAYELWDLWASPWCTAWIIVGYFAAALLVDGLFRGATFCKYLCPIGQFNFVGSMVSPLEVQVRDHGTCSSCKTHDCIRGGERGPGCGTQLFLPRKVGNLDCTFCLDCVSACPHDNIGILAAMPGRDLLHDARRSSLRRLSGRADVAALIVVVVFGAFANALGMVAPAIDGMDGAAASLGLSGHRWVVVLAFLLVAVVVAPALLVGGAAAIGARWSRRGAGVRYVLGRFVPALVPLGLAMWLAHLAFHLATSAGTAIPAAQRALRDLGASWAGEPAWTMSCCAGAAEWILPVQLAALGLGAAASGALTWLVARQVAKRGGGAARLALPWLVVIAGLYALGAWIVFQPMQMRGTILP